MRNDIVVDMVNLYPKGKNIYLFFDHTICSLLAVKGIMHQLWTCTSREYRLQQKGNAWYNYFQIWYFFESSDHSNIVSIVDLTSFHFKVKWHYQLWMKIKYFIVKILC